MVAAHYVEAFRATPEGPDAEALAARARDWLSQAAERALSLGSPEQALTYADQALAITPVGRERASLLQQAGAAAVDTADADRAIAYLEEAIAPFRDLGDASVGGDRDSEDDPTAESRGPDPRDHRTIGDGPRRVSENETSLLAPSCIARIAE